MHNSIVTIDREILSRRILYSVSISISFLYIWYVAIRELNARECIVKSIIDDASWV